ncbi:MAG: insulinase family protein, partial [Bacteroidota bacterium]|nr:insulinase family protein [Bacteroidota bacterium]
MLERKTQPVFRNINKINYQKPDTFTLSNGVPVFAFFAESDKIIGLEIIFNAGVWFQPKVLLASTTNAMLREGTQLYTSGDISEKLDFFGAHLSAHVEKDKAVVGLYCPHKHFSSVLKILTDIVMHPIFPQNELDILIKKRKEQ